MLCNAEIFASKKIFSVILLSLVSYSLSFAQPIANFSSNVISGCAPLVVQFTDNSTGSPTSWAWDFGNNNSSTLQNPGAFYTTAGVYAVKLTATNGSGSNTITKTAYIRVFPTPIANFVSADTLVCNPATVSFSDLSIAQTTPIDSWFWNFGDGYSSTLQNPTHSYPTGNYTVFLTVKDTNGCSDYRLVNQYIHVQEVKAAFTHQSTVCPIPGTVNFTNTSTGVGLNYNWDFGNGNTSTQQDPSFTYNAYGMYNVDLIATDSIGCTATISHSLKVIDLKANFDFTVSCSDTKFTLTFSDSTTPAPATWLWQFGDGKTSNLQNPTHIYSAYQPYTISLITGFGNACVDTIQKTYTPPQAKFYADSFSCQSPFPITFNDQSEGESLSYSWRFSDLATSTLQNPTYTYTSNTVVDSIQVKLTVTDKYGCQNTLKDIEEIKKPYFVINSDPSPASGCIPLNVQFMNASQSKDSIVSWFWDLGNGVTSTDHSPATSYTTIGEYDVKVVATTMSGCKDSVLLSNFVITGVKPDYIDFTDYDTLCWHNLYEFHGTAGYNDTSIHINKVSWIFGMMPWCLYDRPIYCAAGDKFDTLDVLFDTGHWPYLGGTFQGYDTIMFAAGYNGCNDTIYKVPYTVNPASLICHPDHYDKYSDSSIPLSGFQDNCPPIFAKPYLDRTEECGLPNDGVVMGSCSAPYTFQLRNCSLNYDTVMEFYLRDLQTGEISELNRDSSVTNTITLTKAGLYQVFIVTHNDTTKLGGCTDYNENYIIPVDSIVNGFSTSIKNACFKDSMGITVAFTDTTFSLLGSASRCVWDFGDGNVLKNEYIEKPINYTDTIVTILATTDPIIFEDSHNGLTSGTYQSPVHIYTDTGKYIVKQIVVISNGYTKCCGSAKTQNKKCYFIAVDTIHINNVYAEVSVFDTSACLGSAVSFLDTSATTSSSVVKWQWDFGDGSAIDTTENPTHIYVNPGDYDLTLIVKDAAGCTDTLFEPLYMTITKPFPEFTSAVPSGCTNEKVNFNNSSSGDLAGYYWNFGDGTSDTLENPSHLYNSPGTYNVSLTIIDKNGCDSSIQKNSFITIFDKPQAGFMASTLWSDCPPLPVVFTDTSHSGIQSWHWDFGDGQSSTLQSPNHIYTVPGNYDLQLIVSNSNGCKDTISLDDYIKLGGPSGTFSFNPKTGCLPLEVEFISNGINTANYSWDFGDGTIVNNGNDTIVHTYLSRGTFTPRLFLQDSLGCTFIVPATEQVVPDILYADFSFPDTLLCDFGTVPFTNSSVTFYPTDYHWDFGDGDTSKALNPVHIYDSLGTFTISLLASDDIGCSSTLTQTIVVYRPPKIEVNLSGLIGCVPFTVNFMATNPDPEVQVNSWHWDFGDGTTSSSDIITHTYFNTGLFNVTLTATYGNGVCTMDTILKIEAKLPIADFSFSPNTIVDQYQLIHFTNQSQNETSWNWDFGNGDTSNLENPDYSYPHAGNYTIRLIVFDSLGCSDTIVKEIKIIPIVPNIFTPNGDGINDYFTIDGIDIQNCGLQILNRWGNLVYEAERYQNDWRGKTTKGEQVSDGVYYYRILCDYVPETHGYVQVINK